MRREEHGLSDEMVERIRALAELGRSHTELAEMFGASRQHVGRLVRGEQRVAAQRLDAVQADVTAAVDRFLEEDDWARDAGDDVLAATARSLAHQLDACSSSPTAAGATAAPRLAAGLVDVLDRLRGSQPAEPDALDDLMHRRARRLRSASGAANQLTPEREDAR